MVSFDEILPITEVKRDLLALVKKVERLREAVAITRQGKPTAVLVSLDEYEGLIETLEILSDRSLVRLLKKSKKELEKGRFYSHREVWGNE